MQDFVTSYILHFGLLYLDLPNVDMLLFSIKKNPTVITIMTSLLLKVLKFGKLQAPDGKYKFSRVDFCVRGHISSLVTNTVSGFSWSNRLTSFIFKNVRYPILNKHSWLSVKKKWCFMKKVALSLSSQLKQPHRCPSFSTRHLTSVRGVFDACFPFSHTEYFKRSALQGQDFKEVIIFMAYQEPLYWECITMRILWLIVQSGAIALIHAKVPAVLPTITLAPSVQISKQ